jgi:hypothetical protein
VSALHPPPSLHPTPPMPTRSRANSLRGVPSEAMLLVGDKDKKIELISPPEDAAVGAVVAPEGVPVAARAGMDVKEFKKMDLRVKGGRVLFKDVPLAAGGGGHLTVARIADGGYVR